MPIRLLVVADPKMLPALTNGLREGGRFDVLAVPIGDPAAALVAAEKAEAIAIFYGAPDRPLPSLIQLFAAKARARGGKLVAVLQKEQAAQRDDCFRAGARDVFFMPMPREQFVERLSSSLALELVPDGVGGPAQVEVSGESGTAGLEATVMASGLESAAEIVASAGAVVRLSWDNLQAHGIVVEASPARIRFAGLTPDEEAQIRGWLKSATATAQTPPYGQPASRGAPAAGPPPGFADRKPVRPATTTPGALRTPMRVPPPLVAQPPPSPPLEGGSAVAGSTRIDALFDDAAPAASTGTAGGAPAVAGVAGPLWPTPIPLSLAKAATVQALYNRPAPEGAPPALVVSAKRIAGNLGVNEHAVIERHGPDSAFAEALSVRIALDAVAAEGAKLYSASPAAVVDNAAVTAMTRLADEAAARLQKEANVAVGKGSVEDLQLITATSAALSRDALNLRGTADRLRGIAAAPRLGGGGHLDPHVAIPGQAGYVRPQTAKTPEKPVARAELRDFTALDEKSGKGRKVVLGVLFAGLVAAAVNGYYFALPRTREMPPGTGGPNVVKVQLADQVALVTVGKAWTQTEATALINALRQTGIERALVTTETGSTLGTIQLKDGKLVGFAKPKPPAPK